MSQKKAGPPRSCNLMELPFTLNERDNLLASTCDNENKPDGGPSDYYRLDPNWVEVNDIVDHKTVHQWGHQAVHLFNIFKAVWRWGDKNGTTKDYDARKIIYCGCRVYMMLTSKTELRKYLQELLDDKQFK